VLGNFPANFYVTAMLHPVPLALLLTAS